MSRSIETLRSPVTKIKGLLSAFTSQSERTVVLGTVLIVSAISMGFSYLLARCFSVDMLSSLLLSPPEDCWLNWGENIGRHCFSDYAIIVDVGRWPNPWDHQVPLPHDFPPMWSIYPAAAMTPHLLFGLPAAWLGAPILGLLAYLLALTIAVLSPAIWAARGACGLERVVVFLALGALAIPAWAVIDRGNSTGFIVPIALVFLVALRRERWGLVAIMVVVAALVKPQFAVLGVVLLAARKWRLSGLAAGGFAISSIAAYLLWPRDFPDTITQSIHNIFSKNSPLQQYLLGQQNVSYGKAFLMIPDTVELFQTGGKIPDNFLAGPRSLIGYVILVIVVASVVALGRRIVPIMAGIVLLATAAFFAPMAPFYYLVFVLPVAALIVRDPDGSPGAGVFDWLAIRDGRRRAVGLWVSFAAALSIAQLALGQPGSAPIPGHSGGTRLTVVTTVGWAPILWLIASAVIIVSYARRPASGDDEDTAVSASELRTEPPTPAAARPDA
ncbi:glycosyltransferase family 87 protein [Mycobacterium sp. Aquia_216]|uniref:glycosyltransferase family 87 protein n=1 Tax=Mycobacterium sp. Aquia_216 TaxID=2991729 RepID=UPI00227B050B|nr:glycosyltransferase family 87 protein [Mycobacterium sp. Aquia_216]WAJ47337.1 glycosyltransferase family 87 protein [Mycobacterium sp. Aquia_216]